MANKPVPMQQVRSILTLFDLEKSSRAISRQLHIHRNTVESYRTRVMESGFSIRSLQQFDDAELAKILYPVPKQVPIDARRKDLQERIPHFKNELSKRGVTKQLLWIEYRREVEDGYGYSQFCELLSRYFRPLDAVMHFTHHPGELLQVDFAGDKMSYLDFRTGELVPSPVLICSLPYSHFLYVEVLQSACQEFLFPALNHCVEYMGGITQAVKFDNLKQVVAKPNRYEPTFTEVSEQWANHYGTTIMAARAGHPRDKPSVEKGVDLAVKWILAPLRNRVFHGLKEMNKAVMEELEVFNRKPMTKVKYSRFDRFMEDERGLLKPLPAEAFLYKHITWGKVQKNYHVILGENMHQYSVPYQYLGQETKIVYDMNEVEIYMGFERIAVHKRNLRYREYSTLEEHMPEHHQQYLKIKGWDQQYFLKKARQIGPNTLEVIQRVLASRTFIEQSYNSCLGLLRLSDAYGPIRLEAACSRGILLQRVGYKVIHNILKKNLDSQPLPTVTQFTLPFHDNLRGTGSYK